MKTELAMLLPSGDYYSSWTSVRHSHTMSFAGVPLTPLLEKNSCLPDSSKIFNKALLPSYLKDPRKFRENSKG